MRQRHAMPDPRPLPREPYLRARTCAVAACAVAEGFEAAAIAKAAILDAMRLELLELLVEGGRWEKAATEFLDLSDREYLRSPFRSEEAKGDRRARAWKLDAEGRWFREEESHGV